MKLATVFLLASVIPAMAIDANWRRYGPFATIDNRTACPTESDIAWGNAIASAISEKIAEYCKTRKAECAAEQKRIDERRRLLELQCPSPANR
jgi:hypothetical protein